MRAFFLLVKRPTAVRAGGHLQGARRARRRKAAPQSIACHGVAHKGEDGSMVIPGIF